MTGNDHTGTESGGLPPITPVSFTVDALKYGFTSFYKVGSGLWVLAVIFFLFNMVTARGPARFDTGEHSVFVTLVIVLIALLGQFLITMCIFVAGLKLGLMAYEKGTCAISDLGEVLPQARTLLTAILIAILCYLPGVLVLAVPVFGLLGIAWFIFFATKLFPYFFIIIDKNMEALIAFNFSFRTTEGYFWPVALFVVASGLINIVGTLLFGLGVLISFPVTVLAATHAYRELDSGKAA